MPVMKFFEMLPNDIEINTAHDLWNLVKDSNLVNEISTEDLRRSIKAIVWVNRRVTQYGVEGTIALLQERGLEINESDDLHRFLHKNTRRLCGELQAVHQSGL